MTPAIFYSMLFVGAFFAALFMALAAVGSTSATLKIKTGVLQYVFYFIFFGNSLTVLLSARSFGPDGTDYQASNPVAAWAIRITSLFLLLASLDQVIRHVKKNGALEPMRLLLILALSFFWVSNILLPAFFSAHPVDLEYSWTYQLILGIGLLCLSPGGAQDALRCCRNAIVIYCAVSLLLLPIAPSRVLDTSYSMGLLGFPRFVGLASHAILLGMNASVGLWCLIRTPMQSKWLHRIALIVCLACIAMAQSKSVWICVILCTPILFMYRGGSFKMSLHSLGKLKATTALAIIFALVAIVAATVMVITGSAGHRVDRFLSSNEGAQLMTLTGRDRIWEVALQEWRAHPIFGYGLSIFDLDYRMIIGMPFATSGHNQLIDSLARVGLVGTCGMLLYTFFISLLAFRFRKRTGGLSLVLLLSLALNSISEVVLALNVVSTTDIPHYLLLCLIGGCLLQDVKKPSTQRSFGFSPVAKRAN